jgi:predicted lactoylglutathione lyase
MPPSIYLNLPVKDLQKSIIFFTQLGFTFNPQFTDHNATYMIVSETIHVLLLTEPLFTSFTKKERVDTSKGTEAIIGLTAESREVVDIFMKKAYAAGGTKANDSYDHG